MFVGREKELERMEEMYAGGRFEMAVIYGRRRVGKTTLISKFCRNKQDVIFFPALEAEKNMNITALSGAIAEYENPGTSTYPKFDDFASILEHVSKIGREKRLIFVIDEYPWFAESDPSVSSQLQHAIDHVMSKGKIFLILCGSSMSFMENQVLGTKSPLYGRRTAQFKVEALNYRDTAKLNPQLTNEDNARIFGVTGGIPLYACYFNGCGDFKSGLISAMLRRDSPLFEEPGNLLKQELRDPASYYALISAIAGGASRLNEIAAKSGLNTSSCAQKISVLTELGIVDRETPIFSKEGRKSLYYVSDLLYRFWYRFIPPNSAMIQNGYGEEVCGRILESGIPSYMGAVFEKICTQYIYQNIGRLPFFPSAIGRWWGANSETKQQEEIDIVCTDQTGESALFCECKYLSEPVGEGVLETLIFRSGLVREPLKRYYAIFSKSGFTKRLEERAKNSGALLVSLEDIYE